MLCRPTWRRRWDFPWYKSSQIPTIWITIHLQQHLQNLFHGTAIWLFQARTTMDQGQKRDIVYMRFQAVTAKLLFLLNIIPVSCRWRLVWGVPFQYMLLAGNWSEFLSDSTNKVELFKYLSGGEMQRFHSGGYVYITMSNGTNVGHVGPGEDMTTVCNQEAATHISSFTSSMLWTADSPAFWSGLPVTN